MQTLRDFPFFVLCGSTQDDYVHLPAFGRFERIEWPMFSRGDFTRPPRYIGLLDLDGPPPLAHLEADVWAVVRIDRDDPCEQETREDGSVVPGVVRFASGFVLFRGPKRIALSIFSACKAGMPLKTPLSALQDDSGVAFAGDYGAAIAGDEGFARAGAYGIAQAGVPEQWASLDLHGRPKWDGYNSFGLALAGVDGSAFCGTEGLAVAESRGRVRAAGLGVAIGRGTLGERCVVETGYKGVAISQAANGYLTAGKGSVAVATGSSRWFEIGHGGIGVSRRHVEVLDIGDEAVVIAPELGEETLLRLGRDATLICRQQSFPLRSGVVRVFTTCGGELQPGVYAHSKGCLEMRFAEELKPHFVLFQESLEEPEESAPTAPAPAFPSGVPWWEAAHSHDPKADIVAEPMLREQIIVLCSNIPAAELEAGRQEGKEWLGALWGRGELPVSDGAPCCLVRVEGEHTPAQQRGGPIGFRRGAALYRGTLRGAVAALRALGEDTVLDGSIALAGHGGVARVPSRMQSMPLPPAHPEDTHERSYFTPYDVLRGDRAIGRNPTLAIAGDEGFAICDGEAHAGRRGVACVSGLGVARAGFLGIALCENGRAIAGDFGISMCRLVKGLGDESYPIRGGQAVAGLFGIAFADLPGSDVIASDYGIAILRDAGRARTGSFGVAIGIGSDQADVQGGADAVVVSREGRVSGGEGALLVVWDAGTKRWIHAMVGRDGIERGVAYVARNGRFEPWTSTIVTEVRRKRRRWLH